MENESYMRMLINYLKERVEFVQASSQTASHFPDYESMLNIETSLGPDLES